MIGQPETGKWAIPISPGQRPGDGKGRTKETKHYNLRIGRILRVDYVNWVVDIEWMDSQGGRSEVPVSVGMGTMRTFSGFMPEERSLVVCGFVRQNQKSSTPVIVSYLPNGFLTGYNFNPIKHFKEHEQIRCRMQKLYPGEGLNQSTQGAWSRWDYHWQAYASDLSGIWANAFQHAVNVRALNHAVRTAMGLTREGLIIRNDHPRLEGKAPVPPVWLLDQKPHKIVTVDDKSVDDDGIPWVEHRQLIRETTNMVLDVTDEFDDDDQIYDDPEDSDLLIERTLGTLVGAFPSDEDLYGRALRFQVFEAWDSTVDAPQYKVIDNKDLKKQLAEAYHISFLKSHLYGESRKRSFFTPKFQPPAENKETKSGKTEQHVNKEGKIQITVGSSSKDDFIGAGRSVEANFDGSVKLLLGSNIDQEQSLVIDTSGGWNIHINGPDKEGYALRLFIKGNVYELIDGNRTVEVTGDDHHIVHGNLITEVKKNETRTVDGFRYSLVRGHEIRESKTDITDEAPVVVHQ